MHGSLKLAAVRGITFPPLSAIRAEVRRGLDFAGVSAERELRRTFGWDGQVPALPVEVLDTALVEEIQAMRPDEAYLDPATYLVDFEELEWQRIFALLRWITSDVAEAAGFDSAFGFSASHAGLRAAYQRAAAERPRHQHEIDRFVEAARAWTNQSGEGCWPLVTKLPRPDVVLWHDIATDMHRILERLDAVMWILRQRLCDRATVYRFLQGAFSHGSLVHWVARLGERDPAAADRLAADVAQVISNWNDGFYHQSNLLPTLYGETAPMEGTPDIAAHAAACYAAHPALAELLPGAPLPAPIPLGLPSPRALRLYSRPSGYVYDAATGLLRWAAGKPRIADYVTWRADGAGC